jgi:hypothetical protein
MEVTPTKYDPDALLREESVLALEVLQYTVERGKLPKAAQGRWEYERLLEITLAHLKIEFQDGEIVEHGDGFWIDRVDEIRKMILCDALACEALPEVFPDQPQELGNPFATYQRRILISDVDLVKLNKRVRERARVLVVPTYVCPQATWLGKLIQEVGEFNFAVGVIYE